MFYATAIAGLTTYAIYSLTWFVYFFLFARCLVLKWLFILSFFFLHCYRLDFISWDDYIYKCFKNKRRKLSVELCSCLAWWCIVRCKPCVWNKSLIPDTNLVWNSCVSVIIIQRINMPNVRAIELICCYLATSPAFIYLLKVNNRNTRARCEICSKLIIKTSERR